MAADFIPIDDLVDSDYDTMLDELAEYSSDDGMGGAYYELTLQDRLGLLQSCCTDVLWQSIVSARFVIFAAFACHVVSALLVKIGEENSNSKNNKDSKSHRASVVSGRKWSEVVSMLLHVVVGMAAVAVHFESYSPVVSLMGEAIAFYVLHCAVRSNVVVRSYVCVGFIVGFTCLLEFGLFKPEIWHSIRGCHMVLAMKLISVLDDSDNKPQKQTNGNDKKKPKIEEDETNEAEIKPSNFLPFLAYCASPATAIYGPWISFSAFTTSVQTAKFGLPQWLHVVKNALFGAACLLISTCALNGILFSDEDLSRHMIAVRDSYSFILSNFFVSYLSTVIATIGGMTCVTLELATKQSFIVVSKPFDVMVPHSLTSLVVAWSIPMHTWLRRYVFRPIHRFYGPLAGVLATYTASALLHGFNAQIAVVLLSVGVFTYVEFKLRARLAKTFDACIASRPCEDEERGDNVCHHAYDLDHPLVRTVNVAFSFYAVFLFGYATACFGGDSEHGEQVVGYSYRHLISTWSQLSWFGHATCLASFVFDYVTR